MQDQRCRLLPHFHSHSLSYTQQTILEADKNNLKVYQIILVELLLFYQELLLIKYAFIAQKRSHTTI